MLKLLQDAIDSRLVVQLHYDPGERIIEPHALGYGSAGQVLLRAYQIAGVSASGEHENWKMFRLDRIKLGAFNGAVFSSPRDGYRKGDRHMRGGIITEL